MAPSLSCPACAPRVAVSLQCNDRRASASLPPASEPNRRSALHDAREEQRVAHLLDRQACVCGYLGHGWFALELAGQRAQCCHYGTQICLASHVARGHYRAAFGFERLDHGVDFAVRNRARADRFAERIERDLPRDFTRSQKGFDDFSQLGSQCGHNAQYSASAKSVGADEASATRCVAQTWPDCCVA